MSKFLFFLHKHVRVGLTLWLVGFFGILVFSPSCGGGRAGQTMDYIFTLSTDKGDMKFILYDETPIHKKNFLKLVREQAYDGTIFHRIIDGFMIQGGDVTLKEGNTYPSEQTLSAEVLPQYFHRKGALAAARQPDDINPEYRSGAYQFYIVQGEIRNKEELSVDGTILKEKMAEFLALSPENQAMVQAYSEALGQRDVDAARTAYLNLANQMEEQLEISLRKEIPEERIKAYTSVGGSPHLDGAYTVFGQVVEGMDLIDEIASSKRDFSNKPIEEIAMTIRVDSLDKENLREIYKLDEHMRLP